MAITVPVAGTKLSVTNFGKPVADALNKRIVAEVFSRTNMSNLPLGWNDITGATVSFTAIANERYRIHFGANITGATAGQFIAMALATAANVLLNQQVVVLSSQPTYGHAGNGVAFATKASGVPFAAGTVTLKIRASSGAGIMGVDAAGSPSFIVVEDIGADT